MPGVVEVAAGGVALAADLPEEFSGPVDFHGAWVWAAVAAIVVVLAYYACVLILTRRGGHAATVSVGVRQQFLGRIDTVEADVRSGAVAAREGHQRLSELVRGYVERVSGLPATTMSLADFRLHAPHLVDAITVMYPPEFAPDDDGLAHARFDEALGRARQVVSG